MQFCPHVAGRPGQWLFHTSNSSCEGLQSNYSFLCRRWYTRELQNLVWRLPPCPCWWWQARWDWRFRVDWRTGCATLRFGVNSTTTQVSLTVCLIAYKWFCVTKQRQDVALRACVYFKQQLAPFDRP